MQHIGRQGVYHRLNSMRPLKHTPPLYETSGEITVDTVYPGVPDRFRFGCGEYITVRNIGPPRQIL